MTLTNYRLQSLQGEIVIPAKTSIMYDDLELMGRGYESLGDEYNGNVIKLADKITSLQTSLNSLVSGSADENTAAIATIQAEIDALTAQLNATYTNAEVDAKIVELAPAPDLTAYYNKTETEAKIV